MMKKTLIYLLTLLMAFSPAAVFADTLEDAPNEAQAPAKVEETVDVEEPDAEAPEVAEPEETAEEAVEEEAPAEEAVLTDAEEEPVAEPVLRATNEEEKTYGGNEQCYWVGGNDGPRKEAVDKEGNKVYGLFKAERVAGKLGLYYADVNTGEVVRGERLITPTEGSQFEYTKIDGETGWNKTTDGGKYTYLIKNHDEDYYITNIEEDLVPSNGKTYHIKNGRVDTKAGVLNYKDGSKYYIKSDYSLQTTVGFTPDHKYYIPSADGKVRTAQGIFKANDGKTYYSGAGGVIPSKEGLYAVGTTQYYVYANGLVKTDAGFITVGGKKYLVNAGGAISKKAGPIKYGSNWYVADANGVIQTAKGFFKAGGRRYYVTGSSGVLRVNKSFKVSGRTYHATSNGALAVGVHKFNKYYYYSTANGVVRVKASIKKWNNNYYHTNKGGKISTNKKVKYKKKYYIAGKNGVIYRGVFTWKNNMYYSSAKGVLRTKAGLFKYDGNSYYSRSGGKLYRDILFSAGGKKYLAQSNATIKFGYFTWKNNYYLTNENGAIYTKAGIYTHQGTQYFVKKGGPMAKNEFVTYKDNHYYVGSNGAIVKKSFTYKGIKITPNSKTGIISLEDYWKVFPNEKPKEDDNTNN